MPDEREYIVTDEDTGRKLRFRGPAPPTDAEIAEGFRAFYSESQSSQMPVEGAFSRSAAKRFVNNMMAAPRQLIGEPIGETLALGGAAVEEGLERIPFIGPKIAGDVPFSERRQRNRELFPASGFLDTPQPTVEGIVASGRSIPSLLPGGETPSESFEKNKLIVDLQDQENAALAPFQTIAGELVGDALSLFGFRSPIAGRLNQMENRLKAPELFFKAGTQTPTRAQFWLNSTILRPSMKKLGRGIGRSVEAGVEGAMLDILHGDDSLETAAFAMAGQSIGSASLGVAEGIGGKIFGRSAPFALKVAGSALAVGSIWQLMQSATPGGEDDLVNSIESGFDKVKWGLVMGSLAGMMGTGRLRGREISIQHPILADAITALPRGSMISLITHFREGDEAEQQLMMSAMNQITQNPEAFEEDSLRRINEAINKGDYSAIVNELRNGN